VAWTSYALRRFPNTLEFLEHNRANGAAGIQFPLREGEDLKAIQSACERHGMYLEAAGPVAGDAQTEAAIGRAKEAGARCYRAACLGGRRYETFATLVDWKAFVAKARSGLAASVRMAERAGVTIALENHKDWTAAELAALIREYSSERLRVCVDTGNNLSLLEDPYEVIETLAPLAVSTHIKDMALDRHADGFLLAETPLRAGILDWQRIAGVLPKGVPWTLEMMTRNPLVVPCLAPRYWATMHDRPGRDLASAMALVAKYARPIPKLDGLAQAARLQWEEENVRACLHAAREMLPSPAGQAG
jgi:sugar phosphate isomerase/epimerase